MWVWPSSILKLSAAGVGIAIDDYGVGWSNLTRILDLPADTLKLDRSIAGSVLNDPRAAAMLTLADTLGLHVVAEGVETEPVRRHLAQAGCRWAQGRLFAGPVPPTHLPQLLRRLGVHQPTDTGVGSRPSPTHPLHAVPDRPAQAAASTR